MPVTEIPAFLKALQDHRLLDPGQLKEVGNWPEARTPDLRALARRLVQRGWLTAFQVNQLVQGRAQELNVGPYRLLDRLGEGAMGRVYKAHHRVMNRTVALKVIRKERLANPDAVHRFYREVQAAAQLVHPNIVLAYDAGRVGNTHFFAMEHVEGIDLARLVRESGPLPVSQACDYIRQAALGLQHAHSRGLVHRDIKPSNLLITWVSSGRGPVADTAAARASRSALGQAVIKILDMGLARLHGATGDLAKTKDGAVIGSPEYLAPEQALDAQSADIRSDLYSLGCTFYFLLTGRAPFQANSLTEMLLKHQLEEPAPLETLRRDVPPGVAAVVRRLMAKRPQDRYQTPEELVAALEPLSRDRGSSAVGERITAARNARAVAVDWSVVAGSAADTTDIGDEEMDEPAIVSMSGSIRIPGKRAGRAKGSARKMPWLIAGAAGLVVVAGIAVAVAVLAWRSRPQEAAPDPGGQVASGGKKGEQQPPKQLPNSFRLLPVSDLTLEPGETQSVEVRVERKAFKGPINVLVTGLPPDVTALPATIGEDENIAQLHFTAAVHVADAPKDIQVVAAGGSVTTKCAIRLTVQRRPAAQPQPSPAPGGPYRQFEGNAGTILSVACTADGRQVVSGGADRVVRLWDVPTGKEVRRFAGHTGPVLCVAVSGDGRRVLSGGADRTIRLWESTSSKEIQRFDNAHAGAVTSLALSADGRLALSAGSDSIVRLWDMESRREVRSCVGQWGAVSSVAFLPNGKQFLFAGTDGTVRLRDTDTMNEARKFEGHAGRVTCLAVSTDGRLALSGGVDRTLRLWNVPDGKLLHAFTDHRLPITSVAFAPNSQQGLSISADRTLRIWDLTNRKEQHRFERFNRRITRLIASPDGKQALTAGEGIQVWQLPVQMPSPAVASKAMGGTLSPFTSVAFSADGAKAVSGNADRSVQVWDLQKLKEIYRFEGHTDVVRSVAMSADSRWALSVSADGSLRIWDLEKGKSLRRWPAPKGVSLAAITSGAEGKYYLCGALNKTGLAWVAGGGSNPLYYRAEEWGDVHGMALSPDGRRVVFGTSDGTVGVWDIGRGRPVQRFRRHKQPVDAVALSADGKRIVSASGSVLVQGNQATAADCTVRLLEVESGKELHVFQGHTDRVTSVIFTPDGRYVLSGSRDKTVRAWDVDGGKEMYCFREHNDAILALAISPDGRRVLSAGDAIRLWDLPPALTRASASRTMP